MSQTLLLLFAYSGVVDLEDVDGILVFQTILVSTHDGLYTRVDTSLGTGCCLLDTHLGQTGLDGLGHTAELLNLLDVLPCLVHQFVGQGLHIVRTCPRVYLLADLGLVLDIDLSVTGNTG